jgi:nardilysin
MFTISGFPLKLARLWNERWVRKEFLLPWKNRFICRNIEILSEPKDHEIDFPLMIFKNDFCKSFFKADDKFNLPHGFVHVHFKSSLTEGSVSNLNMTSIYSMCIKNFISEKLYPATIVGYNYKLHSVEDGLILKVNGFNDKLPMIVDIISKAMTNFEGAIDSLVFETFQKELKKNCYNFIINSVQFNE